MTTRRSTPQHLTTIEGGGAATVRTTSHTRVGGHIWSVNVNATTLMPRRATVPLRGVSCHACCVQYGILFVFSVCVFPVWVPLRPPVGRFVRPSVWWSAFVRPFVWVAPPPPVGRVPFRFPATFILCHLSVVRRLCCGALAHLARFMNTVTLNMYVFLSITRFTRRNTLFI